MRAAHVGEVSDMAVRLEKQDAIGHIILDRPPANSYDREFMEELDAAIEAARSDDGIKAIVVRSASEKFFSAARTCRCSRGATSRRRTRSWCARTKR